MAANFNAWTTPRTDPGHDVPLGYLMDYFTFKAPATRGADDFGTARKIATNNLGINYFGSYGVPTKKMDVVNYFMQEATADSWRPRANMRSDLDTPAFVAVPYIGPGTGYAGPGVEKSDHILYEGYTKQPRSIGTISDKETATWKAPLLPEVKSDLKDTRKFIEPDASAGWVRGGAVTQTAYHAHMHSSSF